MNAQIAVGDDRVTTTDVASDLPIRKLGFRSFFECQTPSSLVTLSVAAIGCCVSCIGSMCRRRAARGPMDSDMVGR